MKKLFISIILIFGLCTIGYCADEWSKDEPLGTRSVSDIDYYVGINNEAQDRVLSNYNTSNLVYNSAAQITATAGEVTCSNSDGSVRKMRSNTSATTVTWAMIDTGAEAGASTYYVWGNCDADATTVTFEISLSSTIAGLTGITSAAKIGSFYNDASSNIDKDKIYTRAYGNPVNDSSGKNISKWLDIYDFGTSTSSYTERDESSMMIACGTATMSSGTATITNLPFANTPNCVGIRYTGGAVSQAIQITSMSSSSVTFYDSQSASHPVSWICIGD